MSTGKVLLGVLAGAAVGALAGILFAPSKGSRTRKRIVKKGEDYAEGLKDRFNEFVDDIADKYEQVKDDVTDLADKTMSKSVGEKEPKPAKK